MQLVVDDTTQNISVADISASRISGECSYLYRSSSHRWIQTFNGVIRNCIDAIEASKKGKLLKKI